MCKFVVVLVTMLFKAGPEVVVDVALVLTLDSVNMKVLTVASLRWWLPQLLVRQ